MDPARSNAMGTAKIALQQLPAWIDRRNRVRTDVRGGS